MHAPQPESEIAYWELRLELARLLPLIRRLEIEAAASSPPLPDLVSSGTIAYLLEHRCARCGHDLLYGLLGYLAFPSPDYDHVCPACYFQTVLYRRDAGTRAAQLAMIAREHPGLVAGALATRIARGPGTDFDLEARLGGWLPLARLALAPMPRPESWDADLAELARWAGCDAEAIAAVLAEATSPPAETPPELPDLTADDLPF